MEEEGKEEEEGGEEECIKVVEEERGGPSVFSMVFPVCTLVFAEEGTLSCGSSVCLYD